MFNELLLGKEKVRTKTREDKGIDQNLIISNYPFWAYIQKKLTHSFLHLVRGPKALSFGS
jgi:hypothetical protein